MAASKQALDFTNVKEGGNFSKKHMPAGDYRAKVTKVEDAMPKDKEDKTPMWLFTFQLTTTPSATYPYYCKLQENQLWKVRNLLVAAGLNVPKKRVGVDPNKLLGKIIAVSLDDTEYNGKEQSEIGAVFSPNELDDSVEVEDPDDVDDVDEDEDEEVAAPPAKRKAAPAPVEDEDEEEEDEEEESAEVEPDKFDAMDRAELRRAVRKASPGTKITKAMSDDDLRAIARGDDEEDEDEEDEEPAPPAKKKAKAVPVDEDEDELDIEDL